MEKIKIKSTFFLILLILPIFFQIGHGIFNGTILQKNIYNIPLPVSIFSVVIILFYYLITNFKKFLYFLKNKLLIIYFISFIILLFVNFFLHSNNQEKIIYLFQFFLPVLSLPIGFFYFEKNFFFIIYKIIFYFFILHLLFSLLNGKAFLINDMFFFSIYQNLQYVNSTLIFLALFSLLVIYKDLKKIQIIFFITLTFLYSFYAYSLSSLTLFFLGFFLMIEKNLIQNPIKYIFIILFLVISLITINFVNKSLSQEKFSTNSNYYLNSKKIDDILNLKVPQNIILRLEIYQKYLVNFDQKKLFFGSKEYSLDKSYSSAHNIIIDAIYKFGILLAIPFLYLFFFIFYKFFSEQNIYKKKLLLFLIFFLILENMFKVSLKQPYPGLISYYIIGLILFNREFDSLISSKLSH